MMRVAGNGTCATSVECLLQAAYSYIKTEEITVRIQPAALEIYNIILGYTILAYDTMDFAAFLKWSTFVFCAAVYIQHASGKCVYTLCLQEK